MTTGVAFASTTVDAYQSARDAADAYAREHAAELDWRLPEPVAQRELTDAEVEECARAGWEAVPASGPDGEGWMGCGVDREWWARMTRWTMRQEPGAPGFGAFDHAVLSKAAEIRARGSEQPAPRSAALDLTARMAEALNEAIDMRAATGGPVPVKWTVLLAEYAAEKKQ